MRRWFIYGIHRIYQYWLVLNYEFICSMMVLSKLLNIHEEIKRDIIYIYTAISFCYHDRQCDPNQPVFVYDSG